MNYIIKKFLILSSSIFIVVTLTFFLMHALPGDPFLQEKAIPEEIMKALQKHYGLDQPLYVQYFKYLKGLLTFDLGPSFKYEGRMVNDIIREGFPVSLLLGSVALLIALSLGTTLGVFSAYKAGRFQDHLGMVLAVIGISVPSFILAAFLQYFLAIKLPLFPIARWGTFSQTILPALSLAALPMAFIARLVRANMVEILKQDYILTARSKGISTISLLFKHGLKNALLPVLAYFGPLSAAVLTGSFAVEKIFGIPGLGQWFVLCITNRDYTVIMGTTIFYSTFLMLSVFLVDIAYKWIDPRIKNG